MFARAASRHESGERPNDTRWKGGWVGWWGYEMKHESLGGYERSTSDAGNDDEGDGPDACWGWCDRILRRSKDGSWDVCGVIEQSARGTAALASSTEEVEDVDIEMVDWLDGLGLRFGTSSHEWEEWATTAKDIVESTRNADQGHPQPPKQNGSLPTFSPVISSKDYMTGIEKCRKAIYDGNSNELTLTTRFASSESSSSTRQDPLDMYSHLRRRNPAPYSTFLDFPTVGTTILSSSPERFVRIDGDGRVEMKPIKGTRGRVKCVCSKGDDRCPGQGGVNCATRCAELDDEVARELCSNAKERAENLMVSHFAVRSGRSSPLC